MISRYEIAVRVADCGSFTAAAEQLHYTQSAVSQAVRSVEDELSVTLFVRSHGGVSLTSDGADYLPYLRAISRDLAELRRKHGEMLGLRDRSIRIGTFTSVSRTFLPRLMQDFRAVYPSVKFVLMQGEYNSIRNWIADGTVDFGFLCPDAVEGVEYRTLYRDRMCAVLPPGHPAAGDGAVSLALLAKEPFILLDEGDYSSPGEAFRKSGIAPPEPVYKVYDDYSILAMVEQGIGSTILFEKVVRDYRGPAVVLPVRESVERNVAIAWRDRYRLSYAAERFVQYVLGMPESFFLSGA